MKRDYFWLAVALLALVLAAILLSADASAQTLDSARAFTVSKEAMCEHKWKLSEYGLHKKQEPLRVDADVSLTFQWPSVVTHPVIEVDVCELCGLLRLHPKGAEKPEDAGWVIRGDGAVDRTRLITGDYYFCCDGLTDAPLDRTITISNGSYSLEPVSILTVTAKDGTEIGGVYENGTTWMISVGNACPSRRFHRNLRAAAKGSRIAFRYLESCAAKWGK